MEGVASIALLPGGSISGHFIQLPGSICYGLHGTELECERECSKGEDFRLIKLTITDYHRKREKEVVVECRGHDAAKMDTAHCAHGWQKDVWGWWKKKGNMEEEEEEEPESKSLFVNIGPMTITGLDFESDDDTE
ncbi:hypothetical protein M569_03002 [Genlisea aurea]|uniref:Uncharacterized protein n=1 Tax=Genlisea aurea TaxID=192259 RepID=S8EGG1_9LAMI|nr:hypothetical protein M569_03002 [Genlisea aurea]